MSRVQGAVSCFNKGFSCSQAILSTYGEQFGIDPETALKIAAAFGAGMGRMADTCGAATGAFMVLGLRYGGTAAEDTAAKEKSYQSVREFVSRFWARNGSVVCRELLNCDISTPQGFDFAKEAKLFSTICPKLVQDAAEILEELL